MGHNVGDEVIFDGESYHGRLCPDVWPLHSAFLSTLHNEPDQDSLQPLRYQDRISGQYAEFKEGAVAKRVG
jgi:hypothetical protein